MANYEKRKEHLLNDLTTIIEKLDGNLAKLEDIDASNYRKHSLKKWCEEKKAIHEIKKLLHDVNKYEKYDEKEMDKFEKEFEEYDIWL